MPRGNTFDMWAISAAVLFAALCVILFIPSLTIPVPEEKSRSVSQKHEYIIFIDIEEKKLYLLEEDKCIKEYPVASGKKEMPSPIGTWKIVSKGSWGGSFGERWMGLNVPWGTV